MKALIQRVKKGSVKVNNKLVSKIGSGYVVLLGIFEDDTESDVEKIVAKLVNLRIMSDDAHKMNRSIKDIKGQILVVSQFTLCADLTYGRRPSFIKAMDPTRAKHIYLFFVKKLSEQDIDTKTGKFGEYMDVEIVNDGPVTIMMNSRKI